MDFILTIHGLMRWLVAIAGLIAIIKFAYGWLSKADYTPLDKRIMSIFTILLDINVLLGLILLFGLGGGFPSERLEHATTMILAAVTAHLSAIWRKSPNSAVKFRNNLIVVVIALLFIVMGVSRLRGGWVF
jgi:membrane-associated phospholipid phosphatase